MLPAPARRSGRRDYTADAVAHLAVVQFALAIGFTLRESRDLVRGFSPRTPAGARWRALAGVKLREIEARIAQAQAMRELLGRISHCQCETLLQCGRGLARTRHVWTPVNTRARR